MPKEIMHELKEDNIEENREDIEAPSCCSGCLKWNAFRKECFYFWENKKDCTQHSDKE